MEKRFSSSSKRECYNKSAMEENFSIQKNLETVRNSILETSQKCSCGTSSPALMGVSKFKPVSFIKEAYSYGLRDFGENYPQELVQKAKEFHPRDLSYHLIGHLQTNKVRLVLPYISSFHALDSERLSLVLEKECERIQKILPVYIEINIGREETKTGILPEEATILARAVALLPRLKLVGLMCVAPKKDDPEKVRPYFKEMRELENGINQKLFEKEKILKEPLRELSMGMSADYRIAIEEGSTFLRIGTALFGERQKKKTQTFSGNIEKNF